VTGSVLVLDLIREGWCCCWGFEQGRGWGVFGEGGRRWTGSARGHEVTARPSRSTSDSSVTRGDDVGLSSGPSSDTSCALDVILIVRKLCY
jgi:hypothetical protein